MDIEILGSLRAPSVVIKAPISAASLGSSFLVLLLYIFIFLPIVTVASIEFVVLFLHGHSMYLVMILFKFLSSNVSTTITNFSCLPFC